jgi:hypothetical protein
MKQNTWMGISCILCVLGIFFLLLALAHLFVAAQMQFNEELGIRDDLVNKAIKLLAISFIHIAPGSLMLSKIMSKKEQTV